MTTKTSRVSESIPSFVELSASGDIVECRIGHIPRDDVLQYVHEMCVTLAYMSNSYRCGHLAELLSAAATETERSIAGSDNAAPAVEPAES